MRLLPFLLFILVPLAELAILIKVGEIIGIGATILLVISTAVIGVSLLKRQGLAALSRARASLEANEFPIESVVDGACLLVAGAFLLTPGLLTDTLGFLLLVPRVRLALARWAFNKLSASGTIHAGGAGAGAEGARRAGDPPRQQDAAASQGPLIEGEYHETDESEAEHDGEARSDGEGASSPWRK